MGNNTGPYVDLHVHTWHSDSTLSPAEAVEAAVRARVGVFAIADHEGFGGSDEAASIAQAAGLSFIRAAELECTDDGTQYHVLCYGADAGDAALTELARSSRATLDRMSDDLILRMQGDHPALSLADYRAFPFDRALGGWKALHYLVARGATATIREGMALYARYGVTYESAGFPSLDELLLAIHRADGRAVLAHPGHTLGALNEDALIQTVDRLFSRGLDGAECYYPLHAPPLRAKLVALCKTRGRMITAGSDCHGSFGRSRVGEMDIRMDQIDLRGL